MALINAAASAAGTVTVAAGTAGDGSAGAGAFLSSPAGTVVIAICGAIAVLLVLVGIFQAASHHRKGRAAEGWRILIMCLIMGALLFNLNLTVDGIKSFSNLVSQVVSSIGSVTGTGGSGQ